MIRYWPLLFIAIPLIEITLFIKIGGQIGALYTVLIVLATAFVGVNLLRYQGFSTLQRAQLNMARGQMPAMEMMEGLVLAVGGALLITPGFLTDVLGFLCLVPATRRALIRYIMARASIQMHTRFQDRQGQQPPADPGGRSSSDKHTIEGEFRRDD